MAKRFQDNVVWITGGGTGIGKALAVEFAAEGAKLALSGRRRDRLGRVKPRGVPPLQQGPGVPVVVAILGDVHNARNLKQEAGIAVANGLPWEAALTAITLAPARAYGVERTHGSITTGKVANLVVWSGDPFEFASTATDVYVRGVKLRGTTRQNLLRDRYRDLQQVKREIK